MINKISVKREEWEKFYAQAKIAKENNNCFNIPVKCIDIFEPEIKRCEKIEMKINIKHARIYQNKLKAEGNFFIAQAFCRYCKVKYTITIKNKGDVEDSYVNVTVERHGDHLNDNEIIKEKKKKISGEERNLYKKAIQESGQTVKDFRCGLIADENLFVPSENVPRRMNYEEKHKYDLSKGWRENLIELSITSQNLINGKNVNGFIRRIVIEQDFAWACKA
jgi:hypothetical protein